MLPLLDSLAHPTLSGDWMSRALDARFETLISDLRGNGFCGACAVGLPGVGDYDHAAFMAACRRYPCLFPVAGFEPRARHGVVAELQHVRALGFRAIKIHPRLSGMTHHIAELAATFQAAAELDLTVFYCTYMHGPIDEYPADDSFSALVTLLQDAPGLRVVLVHGGDVQLLRYAELVRFNANLLLDLSLTILKYEGSSIDADLRFLFQRFDQRICIGSDHPEYGYPELRRRFEEFAAGLPAVKREGVGFRNLQNFLGWRPGAL